MLFILSYFNMKWVRVNIICLLPIVFLASLNSCIPNVKLVGEYDSLVDTSIKELQSKTTSFLINLDEQVKTGNHNFENNKNFYLEVYGEIKALINRTEVLENGLKFTPMTANIKNLKEQYEDLETLEKTNSLTSDVVKKASDAFDQSYSAIVKHIVFIKWNQEQPEN